MKRRKLRLMARSWATRKVRILGSNTQLYKILLGALAPISLLIGLLAWVFPAKTTTPHEIALAALRALAVEDCSLDSTSNPVLRRAYQDAKYLYGQRRWKEARSALSAGFRYANGRQVGTLVRASGACRYKEGDIPAAVRDLMHAMYLDSIGCDSVSLRKSYLDMGLVLAEVGRLEEAVIYLQRALMGMDRARETPEAAMVYWALADIAQLTSNADVCRELADTAWAIARTSNDTVTRALGEVNRCWLLRTVGRTQDAWSALHSASSLIDDIHDSDLRRAVLMLRVTLMADADSAEAATPLAYDALESSIKDHNWHDRIRCLLNLGTLHANAGLLDSALALYQTAVEEADSLWTLVFEVEGQLGCARTLYELGRYRDALPFCVYGLLSGYQMGIGNNQLNAINGMAAAYEKLGPDALEVIDSIMDVSDATAPGLSALIRDVASGKETTCVVTSLRISVRDTSFIETWLRRPRLGPSN